MKTQSPDTSIELERLLIERLRAVGPQRRLKMARDASRALGQLAWNGLRQRYPKADEAELRRRYVSQTYGEEIAALWSEDAKSH